MNQNINPQKIYGLWDEGFALDVHTISSEFIAYDDAGNPKFDTKRSYIGELMYKLKYVGDTTAADGIVALALPFLNEWLADKAIGAVVPAPFSNWRKDQPVFTIAERLAVALKSPFKADLLTKTSLEESKNQQKDIVIKAACKEKLESNILLVDDIFQTGTTLNACVEVLKTDCCAKKVYALCISKRRKALVYF